MEIANWDNIKIPQVNLPFINIKYPYTSHELVSLRGRTKDYCQCSLKGQQIISITNNNFIHLSFINTSLIDTFQSRNEPFSHLHPFAHPSARSLTLLDHPKVICTLGLSKDTTQQNSSADTNDIQSDQFQTPLPVADRVLPLSHNTTLVNMEGQINFFNGLSALCPAWSLQTIAEKAELTFLIVLSEEFILQKSCRAMIETFQGFLNLFKLETLQTQFREQLFASIKLAVTSSKRPEKYKRRLKRFAKRLNNPNFRVQAPNRQLILQMMNNILLNSKILGFNQVLVNPSKVEYLVQQDPSLLSWKFIKLGPETINLTLRTAYRQLSDIDKNMFVREIEDRISIFTTQFSLIITALENSLQENLVAASTHAVSQEPHNLIETITQFSDVFSLIERFLQTTDKYSTESIFNNNQTAYPPPNLITIIKSVSRIYQIVDLLDEINTENSFQQHMQCYSDYFCQIANCILPLCSNPDQHKLVLRLSYVLSRGFLEFSRLYELDQSLITRVKQDMRDKFLRDDLWKAYFCNIIRPINVSLISKIFTNFQAIKQYECAFNYQKDRIFDSCEQTESAILIQQSLIISLVRADLYVQRCSGKSVANPIYLRGKQKIEIIFSDLLHHLYKYLVPTSEYQFMYDKQEINTLLHDHLTTAEYLVVSLTNMKVLKWGVWASYMATWLSRRAHEISAICSIDQSLLENGSSYKQQRSEIYDYQRERCQQKGLYYQANIWDSRKQKLEETYQIQQNIEKREQITDKIDSLAEHYGLEVDSYINIRQAQVELRKICLQESILDIQTQIKNNQWWLSEQ